MVLAPRDVPTAGSFLDGGGTGDHPVLARVVILAGPDRLSRDGRPQRATGRLLYPVCTTVLVQSRALLLPGSRVGSGTVVGAGAVVSGQLPPGVVAGGVPAVVIRRR